MIEVNAMGEACPIPVVKTLHALQELNGAGTVQTLVDNEIAVQNLTRLAESKGCAIRTEKRGEKEFCVTITTGSAVAESGDEEISCTVPAAQKKTVVVISADHMGEGDEELFRRAGLPGRMIPVPSQIAAGCGLAWKALPQERDALCTALDTAAIGHSGCFLLEMY